MLQQYQHDSSDTWSAHAVTANIPASRDKALLFVASDTFLFLIGGRRSDRTDTDHPADWLPAT